MRSQKYLGNLGRVTEILCILGMSSSTSPPKCPAFSKYIGFKALCTACPWSSSQACVDSMDPQDLRWRPRLSPCLEMDKRKKRQETGDSLTSSSDHVFCDICAKRHLFSVSCYVWKCFRRWKEFSEVQCRVREKVIDHW